MKAFNGSTGSISNFLVAFICLAFGVMYLIKNSFMPYHSQAVSLPWTEIDADFQFLILALIRAVSGGFIVTAIVITWLQFEFVRTRKHWISLLILITGCSMGLASLYATLIIRSHTPGNPPTVLNALLLCLLVIGYIFNRKSIKDSPGDQS